MTKEDFDKLNVEEKKVAIFEAEKVDERSDEVLKCELFRINNFFVEICTSRRHDFKRNINTYKFYDLPLVYAEKVYT